jgi:hypothetical protein
VGCKWNWVKSIDNLSYPFFVFDTDKQIYLQTRPVTKEIFSAETKPNVVGPTWGA